MQDEVFDAQSRTRRVLRTEMAYKHFVGSRNEQRPARRLIEDVRAACNRLAAAGWGALFERHGLNIEAHDLAQELARPLPRIDRSLPGFEDFALEGSRGIEPGKPAQSLLFHAFASPQVSTWPSEDDHLPLDDFPTLAEIEAVEDYVYGARPPSLEDLRAAAGGAHLAIVVFSAEYRPASATVHGKHADMCYSRTGVARVGMAEAKYIPEARGYLPFVDDDNHSVRVQPCRFAAYVAALAPGKKGGHGPMRFIEAEDFTVSATSGRRTKDAGFAEPPSALQGHRLGDDSRNFWIPLHKLFDGEECIRGRTLSVRLQAEHANEKIRRAHLFFLANGHNGGWCEPDISEAPFVITKDIAAFSSNCAVDGSWLLVPVAHPLVEPAEYKGKPLTYTVPESKEGGPWRRYQSSLNLIPKRSGARAGPEYLHARHKIDENGKEVDLNTLPDMFEIIVKGNYRARHYVDYTGEGWVDVECPELALELPRRLPAYSIVASPDFFPAVKQTELMQWTDQSVPPSLLQTIWPESPGRPQALSDQRYAANLELPKAGFDKGDDTMTAIVGHLGSGAGRQAEVNPEKTLRASMLPDAAAGVFAPGWDVSYDRTSEVDEADTGAVLRPGVTFLTNYGLGSPFVEDSMLCAALSSFWPAVAPDITRAVAPGRSYATATPLTDDVIGLGGSPPWDGIQGPRVDHVNKVIEYSNLAYSDYVETALRQGFDFHLIASTGVREYVARTFAMARVYEALGATTTPDKVKWAVISFRKADQADPDLQHALKATGRRLDESFNYRFEMVEHNGARAHTDPRKFDKKLVDFKEIVLIFADPSVVLRREKNGTWTTRELRR